MWWACVNPLSDNQLRQMLDDFVAHGALSVSSLSIYLC
jgi:hypothetical protein